MDGKRYAVLVGNGCFPAEDGTARLTALRCPAADVADLRLLLEQSSHGGYAVTTLVDRPHNEIRRALYDCLKKAGPDDQVLTYYSGHGKLDEQGNLYLAGSDTDPDSLDPTAFAASDLQKYVAESRAGARLVILDCCFSGAVERIFRHGTTKGDIAEQAGQALRAQAGQGVFYLTASTDTQTAEEKDQDRNSLLTKHIIDGIGSGAADRDDDGAVRFSELCGFVQDAIRGEGAQRPLSFAFKAYGDPVVALTGRPALASRREAIEQQVYALRGKRLLDGPDAVRILDHIHRPAADAATIQALHAVCGDDAAFLRTVHRLPELPDVSPAATVAQGSARPTAATVAPAPAGPSAATMAPASAGPSAATVAPASAGPSAATVAQVSAGPSAPAVAQVSASPSAPHVVQAFAGPSAPAVAPASAGASQPEPASRARPDTPLQTPRHVPFPWWLIRPGALARLRIGKRAAVASLVLAASLALGTFWMLRAPDQSAALVNTGRPVGTVALTPYAADPAIGNQANQPANAANRTAAGAYQDGTSLVTRTGPLVNGSATLLVKPTK